MIDNVVVYSPLFNGVAWETLDISLDDIDRIEVIRGPGASLWGQKRAQRSYPHCHEGTR